MSYCPSDPYRDRIIVWEKWLKWKSVLKIDHLPIRGIVLNFPAMAAQPQCVTERGRSKFKTRMGHSIIGSCPFHISPGEPDIHQRNHSSRRKKSKSTPLFHLQALNPNPINHVRWWGVLVSIWERREGLLIEGFSRIKFTGFWKSQHRMSSLPELQVTRPETTQLVNNSFLVPVLVATVRTSSCYPLCNISAPFTHQPLTTTSLCPTTQVRGGGRRGDPARDVSHTHPANSSSSRTLTSVVAHWHRQEAAPQINTWSEQWWRPHRLILTF